MRIIPLALLVACLIATQLWAASETQDYELQEKCSTRASERFKEEFDSIHYAYQNHFNRKKNKCFMWVWSLDGARGQYLFDVNENQSLGLIDINGNEVFRCITSKTSCASGAEWDAFVKSYMEK